MELVEAGGLTVARVLHDFVNDEALPGTGIAPSRFWTELAALVREFGPRIRAALARRDALQGEIDAWHRTTPYDMVPQLLYRTRIIAVGSAYQHGVAGFARAWKAWRADGAGPAPPAAFRATGARFVLFCDGSGKPPSGGPESLAARLRRDAPPAWLRRIGGGHDGPVLYRVVTPGTGPHTRG